MRTLVVWLFAPGMLLAQVNVPYERIRDAGKEPGNWLTYSRDYSGRRYSPLDQIDAGNAGKLRVAWMRQVNEMDTFETSPIVVDGTLFITVPPNGVEALDAATGRTLWSYRKDIPGDLRLCCGKVNRGLAILGNTVYYASTDAHLIALDARTGVLRWDVTMADHKLGYSSTGAPLAVKDKIITGAANGDQGVRDWIGALDAKTGKKLWLKYTIPAPGEPGSETWKGNTNAWQTGGGAIWVTGTYDPATDQTVWGTGNPVPMFDPFHRPGDNLYTNSAISYNPDTGAMNWFFQYTPGDIWDYDEVGTHIMIDGTVAGQQRKLLTHSARNGFLYTMERANGAMVMAKPYTEVNWTKGIDQKTGKPLDYDPNKDVQTYSGLANQNPSEPTKTLCPSIAGGNNYWPSSYSPKTRLLYIPALTACSDVTIDTGPRKPGSNWTGGSYKTADRYESNLTVVDPTTAAPQTWSSHASVCARGLLGVRTTWP
jgi:alcohol dehydrogenase (cytochrome c)